MYEGEEKKDYNVTILTARNGEKDAVLIIDMALSQKVSLHDRFKTDVLLTQGLSEAIYRMESRENKDRLQWLIGVIELIRTNGYTPKYTQVSWKRKQVMIAITFNSLKEACEMLTQMLCIFVDEFTWRII